jgi:hypothetical protein
MWKCDPYPSKAHGLRLDLGTKENIARCLRKPVWGRYFEIFVPTGSRYLETFGIKELWGLGIWKNKIRFKEPSGLGIFLKLQRTAGFQERTNKDTAVLGGIFDFSKNLRIVIRCNNGVFLFLIAIIIYQNQVFLWYPWSSALIPSEGLVQFWIPASLWKKPPGSKRHFRWGSNVQGPMK